MKLHTTSVATARARIPRRATVRRYGRNSCWRAWTCDERGLRKRSGRREGHMQHAGLRDTAQSSHERRSRATAAADINFLFLVAPIVRKRHQVSRRLTARCRVMKSYQQGACLACRFPP